MLRISLLAISLFFCSFLKAQEVDHPIYLAKLSEALTIADLSDYTINAKQAFQTSLNTKGKGFIQSFVEVQTTNEHLLNSLLADGLIQYWEPKRTQRLHYIPSDPRFTDQWHLEQIQAPLAWDITKGDSAVVIGVVDSGVDYNHEDLRENLAYNHQDPINGVDDDLDGYIDNYYGWDFGSNDSDPMVDGGAFLAHGSSICGALGARTDNAIGTASPGFNCYYLPVKITDVAGNIIDTNAGVLYAAEQGAKVINCSYGSYEYSQAEADIFSFVVENYDVLIIASVGNDNLDSPVYPAALANVIGVCATDEFDQKTSISNYGDFVDIAAPGDAILAPFIQDSYAVKSGASMATALVSSAAGLLRAYYPEEKAVEIRRRLLHSAVNIDGQNQGYEAKLGSGRLDIYEALRYNQANAFEFSLSPNPSLGDFILDFVPNLAGNYDFRIFDILGKLIYQEVLFVGAAGISKGFNLSHIKQGFYTMDVSGEDITMSSGIIIVK